MGLELFLLLNRNSVRHQRQLVQCMQQSQIIPRAAKLKFKHRLVQNLHLTSHFYALLRLIQTSPLCIERHYFSQTDDCIKQVSIC